MIGDRWAIDGIDGIVLVILFAFGVGYNEIVAHWERTGLCEGFESIAIAFHVLVTLGLMAVIDWQAALLALIVFIPSGCPLFMGWIARFSQRRYDEQMKQRRETHRGQG